MIKIPTYHAVRGQLHRAGDLATVMDEYWERGDAQAFVLARREFSAALKQAEQLARDWGEP